MRQLLKMLLSIKVRPLTSGCQQVACRIKKIIGCNASSINIALDLPDQFLALCRVTLRGLLVDQCLHLGIAIASVVARGAAGIVLVKLGVRVVDGAAGEAE